jgi:hypothetical protein
MWQQKTLGTVVADRRLVFVDANGNRSPIAVRIGKPVHRGAVDVPWWCPVEVKGLGVLSLEFVAGPDATQAIHAAWRFLDETLPARARALHGSIE